MSSCSDEMFIAYIYVLTDCCCLRLLVEETADYWTYVGSLTTPPLTENVTWVVFQTTMQLSERQVGEIA